MYDVIIIGAGPAGISASLYTKRANLNTLVLYKGTSNLQKAGYIENYYGLNEKIDGKALYDIGINQAKKLGTQIQQDEVVKIEIIENGFRAITLNNQYDAKAIILATGNKKSTPNIKGVEKFEGKGISYCAICDGFFYKNKNVAIIGSGNYAISESIELIGIAKNITILTNGKTIPEYRSQDIQINPKEIEEIQGNTKIDKIKFKDNTEMKIDGLFIAQGVAGSTDFARKLGAFVDKDKIIVNDKMETNIQGLYACGDCTGGLFQISKAVYEGTKAGLEVIKYIKEKNK